MRLGKEKFMLLLMFCVLLQDVLNMLHVQEIMIWTPLTVNVQSMVIDEFLNQLIRN